MHEHECPECGIKYRCGGHFCAQHPIALCIPCLKQIELKYSVGDISYLFQTEYAPHSVDKKLVINLREQGLTVRFLYDFYLTHRTEDSDG